MALYRNIGGFLDGKRSMGLTMAELRERAGSVIQPFLYQPTYESLPEIEYSDGGLQWQTTQQPVSEPVVQQPTQTEVPQPVADPGIQTGEQPVGVAGNNIIPLIALGAAVVSAVFVQRKIVFAGSIGLLAYLITKKTAASG